jgi:hypothetical protein
MMRTVAIKHLSQNHALCWARWITVHIIQILWSLFLWKSTMTILDVKIFYTRIILDFNHLDNDFFWGTPKNGFFIFSVLEEKWNFIWWMDVYLERKSQFVRVYMKINPFYLYLNILSRTDCQLSWSMPSAADQPLCKSGMRIGRVYRKTYSKFSL